MSQQKSLCLPGCSSRSVLVFLFVPFPCLLVNALLAHSSPFFFQWRRQLIEHWNKSYEKSLHAECVSLNKRYQAYNQAVLDPLKPSGKHSLPAVDYKRQISRGTLVEGVDFYLPTPRDQSRLANHFEPYTKEEQEERRNFRYQK